MHWLWEGSIITMVLVRLYDYLNLCCLRLTCIILAGKIDDLVCYSVRKECGTKSAERTFLSMAHSALSYPVFITFKRLVRGSKPCTYVWAHWPHLRLLIGQCKVNSWLWLNVRMKTGVISLLQFIGCYPERLTHAWFIGSDKSANHLVRQSMVIPSLSKIMRMWRN